MSKPKSPQEKSVKRHRRGLLLTTVRLKMPNKRYWSAQMTTQFKQTPFVKTTSKQRRSNVMTLYLDFIALHQRSQNVVETLNAYWVNIRKKKIVVRCPIISRMPFVQ